MCYGILYTCLSCSREALPIRWATCPQCPVFARSNEVNRSIEENDFVCNRVKQPKGCFNLVMAEEKVACERCQDKAGEKQQKKMKRAEKGALDPSKYCAVM